MLIFNVVSNGIWGQIKVDNGKWYIECIMTNHRHPHVCTEICVQELFPSSMALKRAVESRHLLDLQWSMKKMTCFVIKHHLQLKLALTQELFLSTCMLSPRYRNTNALAEVSVLQNV